VTHRDLKPSNVLLAEDGPRVIDFGISRAAESTTLTQTGLTIGSPGFMSPEQAIGTEVGPPSDIFSLGTVLAFAATGKGPFGGGTTASLLYRVVHETPDLDGVPAGVRSLIERCLVKDPAQRPTAVALLDAVGALQPAGNWLPDSVIGMAAAPPSFTPPPGQPAPTSIDGTPAPTAVPVPLVPGFGPTETSMADFGATPPYQATEVWSTPADGSPPLVPGDPPAGTDGPPPRRRRPLVLAAIIGVLVLGGAGAAFAFSSHGHTPTQSRPAADVSSATTAAKSASASASPTASKHPKASASASSHATTTQPPTTSPATAPTTTTSPTPTPTSPTPTTTSPTPTPTSPTPTPTTTSPTPTVTTS
jgi:serine/threonine protein kinase